MIFIVRRVAIASAIAIAVVLMWFRRVEPGKASGKVATVPVIAAARDLPEGVIVDRMALVVAQWPAGTQPAGAYTTLESVVGRVSRVAIYKGEAIVPGRLAPEGTSAGLEVKIIPGKRAYSIRVKDATSFVGIVRPNSRVDMMVVMNDPEAGGKRTAKLFMSNMRVLGIDYPVQRTENGRSINTIAVATIEVTPEEAEKVAIAASQGQIQLVLRGYGDVDSTTVSPGQMPNGVSPGLRRGQMPIYVPPGPGVAARPDTLTVKVFRGRGNSATRFARDSAARPRAPD